MNSLLLPISWLVVGIAATVAGFMGFVYPPLSLLLFLPLFFLCRKAREIGLAMRSQKWLLVALIFIWLSHFIQVLVPETGFDAVWYHLPVAELVTNAHRFVYDKHLYQSINPLFSDAIFFLGFQVFGELGAKLVAYLFGISLAVISFELASRFLSPKWALIATIFISTFQVVAWQSASFYIDIAKAFWEVSMLVALVAVFKSIEEKQAERRTYIQLLFSALLLGASLASKTFSILLLSFCIMIWFGAGLRLRQKFTPLFTATMLTVAALIVALPYYVFSYVHTNKWLYSASEHLGKLEVIGGSSSVGAYVWQRLVTLPVSLWALFMSRDYISPFLVVLMIIVLAIIVKKANNAPQKITQFNQQDWLMLLFSATQWLVWWFVPPLSTRYALSGFIALTIFLTSQLERRLIKKHLKILIVCFLLVSLLQMVPRLLVNSRSLKYIRGSQTKEQYLEQFYDGWIDSVLKRWHKL